METIDNIIECSPTSGFKVLVVKKRSLLSWTDQEMEAQDENACGSLDHTQSPQQEMHFFAMAQGELEWNHMLFNLGSYIEEYDVIK